MTDNQYKDPYQIDDLPTQIIWGSLRFILFAVVMLIFTMGLLLVYVRWNQAGQGSRIVIDSGAEHLGSAERLFLQAFLSTQAERLNEPIGDVDKAAQEFSVEAGQNANQIALRLSAEGIMDPQNESLLLNYLRFYGLDSELEAGTYELSPTDSIPELVNQLTDAIGDEVEVRFLEGWRVEQMANYLNTVNPAKIDAGEFLALVDRSIPIDIANYTFMVGIEPTDSLEGFLFPDTYRLPLDADARYLVDLMLSNFDRRFTPEMRQAIGLRGLTIRDTVTLASIVEREAVLNDEQPVIASAFLNRIAQGIKLDADPTVQYAAGYDPTANSWWKNPLTVEDLQFDSPYNTYIYTGLPPSPIANPGLGALMSVASPATTDFVYFVASCDGDIPGSHQFSVTYEEHLEKVLTCRADQ